MEENKTQMIIGFLGGVSIISVIGLIILAVAFVNLRGSGSVSGVGKVIDTVDLMSVSDGEHIRGNKNAPITIIEWSDFQCPFCQKFDSTTKRILDEYGDSVRLVYRHFPLDSIHPYARKSAEASECAGEQGKFWQYHDGLYAGQSSIQSGGVQFLKNLATNLELNADKFNECLDSGKFADLVEQHYQAGISAGVTGTPGSFLNGKALGGALPYESLKAQIDLLIQ
jgi:protein-disulfide isomerase